MQAYPSNFAAPRLLPLAWAVDMGILRTPMDGGLARQRRLYDTMPTVWAIEFVMPVDALFGWQDWVNQYAYDYFELPLVSTQSSQAGTQTAPHVVRFISNLNLELNAVDIVHVRVSVERAPIAPTP